MSTDALIFCFAMALGVAVLLSMALRAANRRHRETIAALAADRDDFVKDQAHRDRIDPSSRRPVRLTRAQIHRMNLQRKLSKRPMLSAEGIRRAIDAAPPSPPATGTNDWLLYLLIYQAMTDDSKSHVMDIGTGVDIQNGGGRFGGAGATSEWADTNPNTMARAAGFTHDVLGPEPQFDSVPKATTTDEPLTPTDHPDTLSADKASAQEWSSPDPSPTNHSDDSSSSTSSDSSSSQSSDSSSSSSSSDSSSSYSSGDSGGGSSGGDSGGGGGGDGS